MDTGATSHVLEITVISGEDLFVSRRRRVKRNAFAVIKTDIDSVSQRTRIDKDGGSYPLWNEKFDMNFGMHACHINIEIHCKTGFGNCIIGTVNIPKRDFLGGYVPIGYLHFLSYRLRDERGEKNGIINVSVRVKKNDDENVGFDYGFSKPCPSIMPVDYEPSSTSVVMGVPIHY